MENTEIKKVNLLYLLGYIFGPIILCAICYIIGINFFPEGTMAVILFMVPTVLAIVWWSFGGTFLFKRKTSHFEDEFEDNGYKRNQTFYGRGSTVIVDVKKGQLGLIFFWNPFETFIIPAKRITKTWVDDGCKGAGFMKGSSYVCFLFTIDDNVKVKVYTFTSNQRWRMDSDHILNGISKAEMMVEVLEEAKKK